MWPVQTLTLLLCLTDEEQLFAQNTVTHQELPAIEVIMTEKVDEFEGAYMPDLTA